LRFTKLVNGKVRHLAVLYFTWAHPFNALRLCECVCVPAECLQMHTRFGPKKRNVCRV